MKACKHCGAELANSAKFCEYCGKTQTETPAQPAIPVEVASPPDWQSTQGYNSPVSGSYPPAPQKKKSPLAVIAIVLVLLIGALVGCVAMLFGGEDPNEAYFGRYEAARCTVLGIEVPVEEAHIELKSGGRLSMLFEGETYSGKYEIDGTSITVTQAGDEYVGTIQDGVLCMDMAGLEITYLLPGTELPQTGAPSISAGAIAESLLPPTAEVDPAFWQREWYGWYMITDCTGDYADMEMSFWDCCAGIYPEDDDTSVLVIWDEDSSDDGAILKTSVRFEAGLTPAGRMVSFGDGFFWTTEMPELNLVVDPGDGGNLGYDEMIYITGECVEEGGSSFTYHMYLRPWGMTWEDVQEYVPDDALVDDMMPGLYDSWYLPLLESGAEEAPASFGID